MSKNLIFIPKLSTKHQIFLNQQKYSFNRISFSKVKTTQSTMNLTPYLASLSNANPKNTKTKILHIFLRYNVIVNLHYNTILQNVKIISKYK